MSKVVEFELCLNSNRFCLVLEKEKEIEKAKPKTQLNPRSRPKSNPWRPNLSPRRPSSLPCGPHSAARVAFSQLGLPAPSAHQRGPRKPPLTPRRSQQTPQGPPVGACLCSLRKSPLPLTRGPRPPASSSSRNQSRDPRPRSCRPSNRGRARPDHPAALQIAPCGPLRLPSRSAAAVVTLARLACAAPPRAAPLLRVATTLRSAQAPPEPCTSSARVPGDSPSSPSPA